MDTIQAVAQPGAGAQAPVKVRYCIYARKSSESEERQVLSIDSQVKEMLQIAQRDGLEVAEIVKESHSAKAVGQREVFNQLLTDLRSKKFNGILTWAPDRLSRNAGDLGALVDLMDAKLLVEIRTFGQIFTNSPSEKFLLMILGSQAKLENDNKSVNVKRGLRTMVERGLWPSVALTGYLNEKRTDRKGSVIIDPERAPVIKKMFEMAGNEGVSGRKIYDWLLKIKFKSRNGKPLTLSNVYIILASPFYYGTFEYPKGSGKFYEGKHTPLITKELFEKVRERLARSSMAPMGSIEFAFTKLMACGLCGSGVTADEKFKKLVDGSERRHVYYGCTRSRNKDCKCGYIPEEELVKQLTAIMDTLDLDELGMRKQLEAEVERNRKFMRGVLGMKESRLDQGDVDIRSYAKYVLREGAIPEKRELLRTLKSKLVIKNKRVILLA